MAFSSGVDSDSISFSSLDDVEYAGGGVVSGGNRELNSSRLSWKTEDGVEAKGMNKRKRLFLGPFQRNVVGATAAAFQLTLTVASFMRSTTTRQTG